MHYCLFWNVMMAAATSTIPPTPCIKNLLLSNQVNGMNKCYPERAISAKELYLGESNLYVIKIITSQHYHHHSRHYHGRIAQIIFHNMKENDVKECQTGISTVVVSRGRQPTTTTCTSHTYLFKYLGTHSPAYLHVYIH